MGVSLLAGCAGMQFGLASPDVSVVNIRLLDGNLLEQRFLLTLRVINPNNVDIAVEGLTFTVDLNDQPFAKGVSNQATVIPRLGDGTIDVTATTGLASFLRQFRDLRKIQDRVEYRLKGRLVTGRFGGINFDRTGQVSLSGVLGDGGGRGDAPPAEKF